jgi:Skp family chaperone for outer membrane proteins
MSAHSLKRVVLGVAVALSAAAVSAAQPPASPKAPVLDGPAIAGVCLLSREAVVAHAKVGMAASARIAQLAQQAQAEVDVQRKPVEVDIQKLRAQASSLKPDDRMKQEQAIAARMQQVQQLNTQRSREIEVTREKATGRIAEMAQPVIASVYKSRGCGLLLDRNAVLGGNMSNDLTAAVVQGLDASVTTISFERENLPANGGQRSP